MISAIRVNHPHRNFGVEMAESTLPSILKKMECVEMTDCHLSKRWKFPSCKWQNAIQDASSFYVNNGTTTVQQYSCTAVQPYPSAVKLNGRARARAGSQSGADFTAEITFPRVEYLFRRTALHGRRARAPGS